MTLAANEPSCTVEAASPTLLTAACSAMDMWTCLPAHYSAAMRMWGAYDRLALFLMLCRDVPCQGFSHPPQPQRAAFGTFRHSRSHKRNLNDACPRLGGLCSAYACIVALLDMCAESHLLALSYLHSAGNLPSDTSLLHFQMSLPSRLLPAPHESQKGRGCRCKQDGSMWVT